MQQSNVYAAFANNGSTRSVESRYVVVALRIVSAVWYFTDSALSIVALKNVGVKSCPASQGTRRLVTASSSQR